MNNSSAGTRGEPPAPSGSVNASPRSVPLAGAWVVGLFVVAAVACSWLVVQFGELGGVGIWAAGGIGGLMARKITSSPSRAVAWALVGMCVLLFFATEVSWIHWKTKQGADLSWAECFTLLPVFFREYKLSAFIGALFTFFGAQSAYWQAGRRYRMVAVEE